MGDILIRPNRTLLLAAMLIVIPLACRATPPDRPPAVSPPDRAPHLVTTQEDPTPEQFREMGALTPIIQKLPQERLEDLWAEMDAKAKVEHWTGRERAAWMIQEIKKAAETEAAHPTTTHPAIGEFVSTIEGERFFLTIDGLRFFSPTFGVAVTDLGVLTTDGSLDHWKGVTGWDKPHGGIQLVGGSDKAVYLTTCDGREVIVKEGFDPPAGMDGNVEQHGLQRIRKHGKNRLVRYDYTFTLWRWTLGAGLSKIRNLPHGEPYPQTPSACEFASERIGAFADGRKLMVTTDAAKTWVESPLPLEKNESGIIQLVFCGDDRIAIMSGTEAVAMLTLDKDGHAQQQWRSPIFGRYGAPTMLYDPWQKVVWAHSASLNGLGDTMQAFRLVDGKVVAEFAPVGQEGVKGYSVCKGRMYTWGMGVGAGNVFRTWNIAGKTPTPVAVLGVEDRCPHISQILIAPGSDQLWVLLDNAYLVRWDGKSAISPYPTKRRGPTVETAVLDYTEDHWPPGDWPSRREGRAHSAAIRALTGEQHGRLLMEFQAKRDNFDNPREQTLWMTKRAKELRVAATQPAARPAPP
ncbi:MAG: hypothetical protein PHU85_05340 [Phycisphaerae bacterium]|nr:hypothetical protein [Phycisphaerae bacterium]